MKPSNPILQTLIHGMTADDLEASRRQYAENLQRLQHQYGQVSPWYIEHVLGIDILTMQPHSPWPEDPAYTEERNNRWIR